MNLSETDHMQHRGGWCLQGLAQLLSEQEMELQYEQWIEK